MQYLTINAHEFHCEDPNTSLIQFIPIKKGPRNEAEFSRRFLSACFIPVPTEVGGNFEKRVNDICVRQSNFIDPVLHLLM